MTQPTLETIANLAKKRGFVYQASEIYGRDPLRLRLRAARRGAAANVKDQWWRDMVQLRDDVVGIDSPSSRPVRYGRRRGTRCSPIRWSSVELQRRHRLDKLEDPNTCPTCGKSRDIHRAQAISSHVPHPHGAG